MLVDQVLEPAVKLVLNNILVAIALVEVINALHLLILSVLVHISDKFIDLTHDLDGLVLLAFVGVLAGSEDDHMVFWQFVEELPIDATLFSQF